MSREKEANKEGQKRGVRRKRIEIADELIDRLLKEYGFTEEGIFGADGAIKELTGRLVERALAGELTHHLGYAKGELPEAEGARELPQWEHAQGAGDGERAGGDRGAAGPGGEL